jgi:hypothetical protein
MWEAEIEQIVVSGHYKQKAWANPDQWKKAEHDIMCLLSQ